MKAPRREIETNSTQRGERFDDASLAARHPSAIPSMIWGIEAYLALGLSRSWGWGWYLLMLGLSAILGWAVARWYSEPANRWLRTRLKVQTGRTALPG